MSEQFNKKSLCKYFEVSRSGYYKYLKRKGTLNRYEMNREDLKTLIIPIHDKHTIYGYRNLAKNIRNRTGWLFSDWLCHKCCLELHIQSKARKKYTRAGDEHEIYSNLLNGDFTATRPFEKICTDTTSFYYRGKVYDWTIYLDLFNNEIIAYDLRIGKKGNGIKNHFTALNRFQLEKQKRGYNNQATILHSDQGSIYTSRAYNARLHYTIKRSMSRIATPTDNPVIEALNGWIKDELRLDFNLAKTNDLHNTIRRYVKYFNSVRLAYALKYKSPIQYKTELDFL